MSLRSDLHSHSSEFSGDASSTMEEMVLAAIEGGLERICITDHVDYDPNYDDSIPFDAERYTRAIETMRERYGDQIEILKGVEVGEAHRYPKEYEELLKGDYDMIIASIHYINLPMGIHWTANEGKAIFTFAVDRIYRRYYEELKALVELGGFDVLGHFDHPRRYLLRLDHEDELIEEIIGMLVEKGIVPEINTSPLRKGVPETAPGKRILDMYRKAGGKRVTVGADAHNTKDLAYGFDTALQMAEGFTLGYFRKRKFIPLR